MKQATKNKYCFGLGTVGRDALYSLISMNFMIYITKAVNLDNLHYSILTVLVTIFSVFDAINDPFMGTIVDNTKTKWGKFKPWILTGMLATGILTVVLFHNVEEISDTIYVIIFGITYFLWSCSFTINDMSYWGMMPAISKDSNERESIGAIARICASVGMFASILLFPMVPDIFAGLGVTNIRDAYMYYAIILVLVMWGFQLFTLFGVKEDRRPLARQEHTSLKQMFSVLLKNDQLMWAGISMALFMIGYSITTSFGIPYFELAVKNGDMYMVFAAVLAVAQLTALSVFNLFRKKFTRKQLYTGSMIAVVIAYLLFFFSFEKLPVIIVAGLILFSAQAFIQLLTLLFLADAVEYGEWKLGKRNDSISFAVQPFVNQIGSAISKGVLGFTLLFSGLKGTYDKINEASNSGLESEVINGIKAEIVKDVNDSSIWIMKVSMMIIPLICIVAGFIIYEKKFKIDEKMYAQICADLEERNK